MHDGEQAFSKADLNSTPYPSTLFQITQILYKLKAFTFDKEAKQYKICVIWKG